MKLAPSKSTLFTIILYILAAGTITWPLPLRIENHLPLGTESSATVPLFNLWTLLWNADRLKQAYSGYWNAPIFYPETGTLAFSEPQPLTGLIFSPLAWLLNNPVAAYNTVLLLFLTLNGISAAYLLQKLGIAKIPAVLGGLLALALPFVTNEFGVLQLTPLFPIFFALRALYAFAQKPGWQFALSLGAWSAVAFLFSSYYGLFLTIFILLAALLLFKRSHLRPQPVLQLSAALLLAALILLPILPTQRRLTANYTRSDRTIQNNSAELQEYTHLYRRTLGSQTLPWIPEDDGRQRLFPGTILLFLATVGLIVGIQSHQTRRWTLFALLGAALAFMLSFGLNLSIGDWQPYRIFKDDYPGFAQLRSPFRLAVFVQIFLITLAGITLHTLWRRSSIGRLLTLTLVIVALIEVVPYPARLYPVPQNTFTAPWISWLKNNPEDGAVLMLPMSQNATAAAFQPTVIGMIQSLQHHHPLGNGYSGFFPTTYRALKGQLIDFPTPEAIEYIQNIGFHFIVIDQTWWTQEKALALSQSSNSLTLLYEDETKLIYQITPSQP